MKQQLKAEIKRLSDILDNLNRKSQPLLERGEMEKLGEIVKEKQDVEAKILRLRAVQEESLSKEAQQLKKMPFNRAITKKEQANLGALKKTVRGLILVHPTTALGREMGITVMTGFAKTEF